MTRQKHYTLDERSLRAAVDAALGAVKCDDMLVHVHGTHSRHLRFARNNVTTSGEVDGVSCSVTAVVGNKHATVNVQGLDQRVLVEAAKRARQAAELMPEDPEFVPYPGAPASAVAPVDAAWGETTAQATPQKLADGLVPVLAEARSRKLESAGFLSLSSLSRAVATKAGFFATHHETDASFSMTARTADGTGSGWSAVETPSFAALELTNHGIIACDKAERARSPRALAAGHYSVVLEPAAVAELLGFLWTSLDLRDAEDGQSAFSAPNGKTLIGQKVLGHLNIWADPRDPLLPQAPFDYEGTPRTRLSLIEDGVIKALPVSRYWGKKTNRPPTAAFDTVLASGTPPQAELWRTLDKGLLVTRFWYCRWVDPKTLTITGLTRDGVFLVENGEIVDSVNNFRFNISLLELFANTDAYGAGERHEVYAPTIRAHEFNMSTKSDAV